MKRSSATSTSISRSCLLLGHRGASRYAPENTLAAFDLALQHGCDGFEFDVRGTADGKAVICHDRKIHGRMVAQSSYAELTSRAPDLPLLTEVIRRFAPIAFLDIEVKESAVLALVVEAVSASRFPRGYVVSSFLPEVLSGIRRLTSDIPLGFITDKREHLTGWNSLEPDYLIPKFGLVGPRLVDEVHAAGKKLITWTVNNHGMMRRMAEIGVDGIISDDTRRLGRLLG